MRRVMKVLRHVLTDRRFPAPRFSRWRNDPRVLVEESDGAIRESVVNLLEDAGFEAVGCGGPGENHGARCPLSGTTGCSAAADADVIFFSFRLADPENQQILRMLKRQHPNTPIVVEVPKPKVMTYQELLVGTHPVYTPLTRRTITRAVLNAWAAATPSRASPSESRGHKEMVARRVRP